MRKYMIALTYCAVCASASWGQEAQKTYAERLGWPAGSRVLMFHCDDAGMSHSSNRGAIEALEFGVCTSVSTMMPCGWVPEFAEYLKAHPDVDNGLHLTLTSEWSKYRWGSVAGSGVVPSLLDEQGCLHKNVGFVATKATPDDIEKEIRAQIEKAERMGIPITHIDSHMGTLFARPDFFERYMKVGIEKQIPILMMGGHMEYLRRDNPMAVKQFLDQGIPEMVWQGGLPVLDDLHNMSYGWKSMEEKKAETVKVLRELRPGVTMFILHCSNPTEVFKEITDSGPTRQADLKIMTDPEIKRIIEEEGIILTTWRELKQRRDAAAKN